MATLTVRNLDDSVKARLRMQAAQHGWAMEEEVRRILTQATQEKEVGLKLGSRIRSRFSESADLVLPARKLPRSAPVF